MWRFLKELKIEAWYSPVGPVWREHKVLKIETLYDQPVPLLSMFPKDAISYYINDYSYMSLYS